MNQIKTSKLEELRSAQHKLKAELKVHEERLNDKMEFLESNFGSMMLNSVLPFNEEERAKAYGIMDKVNDFIFKIIPGKNDDIKNERYSGILKSIQMIVGGIVFKYLKKFF